MADLIIRGMEMPKYFTKAEFGIDADGNPLCVVYHEDGTEPDIYDVVPLPAGHGRLGDLETAEAILHNKTFDSPGRLPNITLLIGRCARLRHCLPSCQRKEAKTNEYNRK